MKKWEKPKLLVLVRSKPEEAVLANCKEASNINVTGAAATNYMCSSYVATCQGTCDYIVNS